MLELLKCSSCPANPRILWINSKDEKVWLCEKCFNLVEKIFDYEVLLDENSTPYCKVRKTDD